MKIHFCLTWLKPGEKEHRAFKNTAAAALFRDYLKRISRYARCEVQAGKAGRHPKKGRQRVWVCHNAQHVKALSSEELARALEDLQKSGFQDLQLVIGGPDGFSEKDLGPLKPDLMWSFGPLTYPHELAAIVAAEQIYRAFTILKRHPYHLGH